MQRRQFLDKIKLSQNQIFLYKPQDLRHERVNRREETSTDFRICFRLCLPYKATHLLIFELNLESFSLLIRYIDGNVLRNELLKLTIL